MKAAQRPATPGARAAGSRQRGAAALVVVMVLFFVVALVAAYASRSMLFEQRTSANQYRAMQAFEAAEAGVEWALAMLNSGRIADDCLPLTDPDDAGDSFRQRHLEIDEEGTVRARTLAGGGVKRAGCVFDGGGWTCSCPSEGQPALAAPEGDGSFPAFRVEFENATARPGVVRLSATGCTRLDEATVCPAGGAVGDALATVSVLVALVGAVPAEPAAAMTVRGTLDGPGVDQLAVFNRSRGGAGLALRTGGGVVGTPYLGGGPGTPDDTLRLTGDTSLGNAGPGAPEARKAERMFEQSLGLRRDTYRWQPATVVVDCSAGCDAEALRDVAQLNPGRVLWLDGDATLSGAYGSDAVPLQIVVTGDVTVDAAGATLAGVVYSAGSNWTLDGPLTLRGALIAEGDLQLGGTASTVVALEQAVVNTLRTQSGSFVRVPGSWRDFGYTSP